MKEQQTARYDEKQNNLNPCRLHGSKREKGICERYNRPRQGHKIREKRRVRRVREKADERGCEVRGALQAREIICQKDEQR